jgi:hypothetical protein
MGTRAVPEAASLNQGRSCPDDDGSTRSRGARIARTITTELAGPDDWIAGVDFDSSTVRTGFATGLGGMHINDLAVLNRRAGARDAHSSALVARSSIADKSEAAKHR